MNFTTKTLRPIINLRGNLKKLLYKFYFDKNHKNGNMSYEYEEYEDDDEDEDDIYNEYDDNDNDFN